MSVAFVIAALSGFTRGLEAPGAADPRLGSLRCHSHSGAFTRHKACHAMVRADASRTQADTSGHKSMTPTDGTDGWWRRLVAAARAAAARAAAALDGGWWYGGGWRRWRPGEASGAATAPLVAAAEGGAAIGNFNRDQGHLSRRRVAFFVPSKNSSDNLARAARPLTVPQVKHGRIHVEQM